MNIVWKDNNDCLQIFKAIAQTNNIVNVVCGATGLNMSGMDASKTSLVQLHLPPEYFEHYECSEPLEIGLYTASLVAILHKVKKNKLIWKCMPSATSLNICFIQCLDNNASVEASVTEFNMRAIDVNEDHLAVPDITDDVAINIDPHYLTEILDKMIMAKSALKFNVNQTSLELLTNSSEFGTITHKEKCANNQYIECEVRQSVSLLFGYNAVMLMMTFCKVSKQKCFLGLSNEMPLRLKINLGNGAYIAVYIAPKIEDNY